MSKKVEKISEFMEIKTPYMPAKLLNNAGIIGAALYTEQHRMNQTT